MPDPRTRLAQIGAAVRDRFESEKRVLSMEEYLALFEAHPWRHSRDAARYLADAFDHYGSEEIAQPPGMRRFRLFDLPFLPEEKRRDHLAGQERLQNEVYRILRNFVREGRTNRLILLHGPNGSAKSTFVHCILRALEHYSTLDEGALYRFSWIFPRGSDGKTIGFGSRDTLGVEPGGSYAHLPDEQIDVKLTSELRENPLLLLPEAERRALIQEAYEGAGVTDSEPPRAVAEGHLSPKNRQIFDALLTAYRGDLARCLAHVRVERYHVSRRYRVGAVTLGPEMAVDAKERQISVDRSLGALPASLSALTLYESVGELVDASGGVLEYSDLLKRPVDAWRYLLLAIETGEVGLVHSIVPLNSVLVATSNELHLEAFRQHHEYKSFRGRLSPVRVPYLLDYSKEQEIYDSQLVPQVRTHVAPHATYVVSLWAVLTRLRKPQKAHYEARPRLAALVDSLSPLEKAEIYADGKLPSRLSSDEAVELRSGLARLRSESDNWPRYEGLTGASPREIRTLFLDAAQDPAYACLSPLAVLSHLEAFCEADDYDFLQEKEEGGFHAHRAFVDQVRERWLDRVDAEFRDSTGIVEEEQYQELFRSYVTHVSYWVKGERLANEVTGNYEDADESMMQRVEALIGVGGPAEDFRKDLISAVAGHAIDNPGQEVDYQAAFPHYVTRLREASYRSRRKQLGAIAEDLMELLSPDLRVRDALPADRRSAAEATRTTMIERYGYADASIRDGVGELLRLRYVVDDAADDDGDGD
jgi:serine protein kinase